MLLETSAGYFAGSQVRRGCVPTTTARYFRNDSSLRGGFSPPRSSRCPVASALSDGQRQHLEFHRNDVFLETRIYTT